MSRKPEFDPAMVASMFGMQQPGARGAAVALALVAYTLEPWREPTGAGLERAQATAVRFRLSPDLARFVPAEPGRIARRSRAKAFQSVVVALKQLDSLEADERAEAIAQLATLLGTTEH
ncbi:MAG: hypothetical protein JXP37_04395 [Coriobacteriia bacterium]|nr:hypothetical protein [Coriobacteriia bacterium]